MTTATRQHEQPSGQRDSAVRVGLEGVVVAETALSFPDSANRRLIIRGIDAVDLIREPDFEAACTFLWQDLVPGGLTRPVLGQARVKFFAPFQRLLEAAPRLTPIDAMRLMISSIPDDDADPATAADIVAAIGVAAALALRAEQGKEPVVPDVGLSHAADVLRMIRGSAAEAAHVRAFELYLVTMFEHSLNASTFAARAVASTRAGIVASVVAALCSLRGPLHGGAPSLVLDMLDEVRSPEDALAFVSRRTARNQRVFGFGSRGYHGRDPRTDTFKHALTELTGRTPRLEVAEAVETAVLAQLKRDKPNRRIETNVEYYGSLLMEALGIPRSGFTPMLAVSRVAGWIGHIREEEKVGRLMRPAAHYTGTLPAVAAKAEPGGTLEAL